MCGIAGIVGSTVCSRDIETILKDMNHQMVHRGPDEAGNFVDRGRQVGLAHTRLAIRDLSSAGSQPMPSADHQWVVVFNGEIYNSPDLRHELIKHGHRFRGTSDTEILVEAISKWGFHEILPKLNGMFAIAALDLRRDRLLLARDRFGEKPLYYGNVGGDFVFASELKALRRLPMWSGRVDRRALNSFLAHGYIPAPLCIYRGLHKLTPGDVLDIRAKEPQRPYFSSYFDPQSLLETEQLDISQEDATELVKSKLKRSVRLRTVSDVPLGALLSGGVDSSLIAALLTDMLPGKISTFTIGFRGYSANEAPKAAAIARHLRTNHHELYLCETDICRALEKMPQVFDEPFGDTSQIPSYLVAEMARRNVTVVLTGDAGDELFAGYDRYRQSTLVGRGYAGLPANFRVLVGKALASANSGNLKAASSSRLISKIDHYSSIGPILRRRVGTVGDLLSLPRHENIFQYLAGIPLNQPISRGGDGQSSWLTDVERWPEARNNIELYSWLDLVTYLPDNNLAKLDRTGMSVSLEARAPMLDPDLVELAFRLPTDAKIRRSTTKWVLRRLLDSFIPPSLIKGPKRGFSAPVQLWLSGFLRDWAESLLSRQRLDRDGLVDTDLVRELWNDQLAGRELPIHQLWWVLSMNAWLDGNGAVF